MYVGIGERGRVIARQPRDNTMPALRFTGCAAQDEHIILVGYSEARRKTRGVRSGKHERQVPNFVLGCHSVQGFEPRLHLFDRITAALCALFVQHLHQRPLQFGMFRDIRIGGGGEAKKFLSRVRV